LKTNGTTMLTDALLMKNLSEKELHKAIDIADTMIEEGKTTVEKLNKNSLRWRDKL